MKRKRALRQREGSDCCEWINDAVITHRFNCGYSYMNTDEPNRVNFSREFKRNRLKNSFVHQSVLLLNQCL